MHNEKGNNTQEHGDNKGLLGVLLVSISIFRVKLRVFLKFEKPCHGLGKIKAFLDESYLVC